MNRKVNAQRYFHYKKRSHEESLEVISKILFSKSLLEEEETRMESIPKMPPTKKKRRETQVVMYFDRVADVRRRLYPTMSVW